MVRITKCILKRCSSKTYRANEEDKNAEKNFITHVTHLYLQEKNIRVIENLELCKNLLALYLYDNKISKIENLGHLNQLTSLYLYNNRIQKIENLQSLPNLKCLKLGRNKISVVEGLEHQTKLEELWVESQELPIGEALTFERSSVMAIAYTLKVINVSDNGLKSLVDLVNLRVLEQLYAENNLIDSLQGLVDCAVHWTNLVEIKLRGNTVCRERKFRDNVVVYCSAIQLIDEFTVSETYRMSVHMWMQMTTRRASDDEVKHNKLPMPFLKPQAIYQSHYRPLPRHSAPELSKALEEQEPTRTKSSITV